MIEAPEYEETRQRLMNDPIVLAMANEIASDDDRANIVATFTHDDGGPRFSFMQSANREYERRGGTDGGHIGGIAEALLRLINA